MSVLGGAADGQCVDAVGVTVTVATVAVPSSVARRPDEDVPFALATLGQKNTQKKGLLRMQPKNGVIRLPWREFPFCPIKSGSSFEGRKEIGAFKLHSLAYH